VSKVMMIIGKGLLADSVSERLSDQFIAHRLMDFKLSIPTTVNLVLVLSDVWRPAYYEKAEKILRQLGLPWLRGFILHDEGIIGPLVSPGKPGCSQCADTRKSMAEMDSEEKLELQMNLLMHGEIPSAVSVTRLGIVQVSYLIAAEAQKIIQGSSANTIGKIYCMNLKSMKSSLHSFLPDPLCPFCGGLSNDCSDGAQVTLQPRIKINADSYRCRSLEEYEEGLTQDYLDERTGIFNRKTADWLSPFSNVYLNLPSILGNETSAGRSHSYFRSEQTAILEGLERYCGISPRGKQTVIHDCYRHLSDHALNPEEVGVYSADQYALADFPFVPFDPELPMNWVWAYSFMHETPILVPEQLAYYSLGAGGSFVSEGSNGCALGSSMEEAIFYGIMEVVERDSFLLTWYAQLSVPRLDPDSSNDKELKLMVDRLQTVAGYDVLLFNTTMDNGIPSVCAILKNKGLTGANLICAGGAHLDPIRAVKSAILEVAGHIQYLAETLKENKEEVKSMLDDPYLVRRMEDHSLLYGIPEAEERLQFLLKQNRPLRTFEEEFKLREQRADLTEDLRAVLQRFRHLNLNVIVVDQTTPESARNGLYCVKVLIPGMLPMSFGHQLVRLTGLERLLEVPRKLGYTKHVRTPQSINPHPHPFL